MGAALSDAGLSTDIARDSERYIFALRSMADADPRKTALQASYTRGFHAVFAAMTAISATSLVASFAIRKLSVDKSWLNLTDMGHETLGARERGSSIKVMTALATPALRKPIPIPDALRDPAQLLGCPDDPSRSAKRKLVVALQKPHKDDRKHVKPAQARLTMRRMNDQSNKVS